MEQVIEFVTWLVMYLPLMLAEWAKTCPYLADIEPGMLENVFLGGEGIVGLGAVLCCWMCWRCCKKCKAKPAEVKPEE